MWLSSLFGTRKHASSRSKASKSRRDALHARRLFLEPLEDRRLLAFDPAVSYLAGNNPQAIATGHFNSDLFLDIAVANVGSSDVSVLLGNADGTFQSAVNSPTGSGPVSLAVGDFNEDGMLDLATANSGDVSVLLGNGNGTFDAPTNINVGSNPVSVAVGDINADGNLDLAVTSNVQLPGSYYYGYYGGTYYSPGPLVGYANVLLGNGVGDFAAPATTFLGYGTHAAANVTDLNGDGRGDFVTLNSDYGLASVLLTTATGTLGPVATYATGWYPRALTIGDFTNDGILDLATAGQTVDILPGLGNGTFRPVVRQYIDPVSIAAADFNRDGKLDLVTADPWANSVSAALGLGTGALTLGLTYAAGTSPTAVAVGDFNGDGRADVAAASSSSGDVSVLINDGDWPALTAPSLRISDAAAVTEGNIGTKDATFNVTLSAPSTQTITVHYDTVISGATSDDFQAASGIVTFGPGETTKPITVKINGDRLAEYYESFGVSLTDPSGAFIADAVGWGTIYDDEPYVSITSYVTATEGNSGTTAMNFAVTLSAAYDAAVTVDFATADYYSWYGSAATAGVDYTAGSGTVTFAPQDTTENITVLIQGDRDAEYSESFFVNLIGSNSAHLSYSQATGVIVDDEPTVSINSTSGLEGNEGTKEFTFTVTLSAVHDEDVRVGYSTGNGTAAAGSDFEATSGTVLIPAGQTSQTVKVLISGDRVAEQSVQYYYDYYYGYYSYFEDSEYFSVNLTSSDHATIASGQGIGTILDDEPRVSIGSATVVEGHEGTKTMNFPLTLSAPYDAPVTVTYSTANGSATVAGGDYQAATGSVTFAAGQTSQNIPVLVNGDRLSEYDESFYVNLTGAPGAFIASATGYGTIQDDEPRLSINSVSLREGARGTKVMTFTVTLAAASDQTVTVNYATVDSSAKAGEDYVATSGSLTFAAGDTTKTISVTIKGDKRKEWDESFYVLLSNASSNAQIASAYGWGTIQDDDR
ncbi:MAG: FG-GAP-like repeat-containing protein [Planctomycetaceae bacterium]|nr:FG-GAP-like repeat-containing protein [Planctomycetaceae bacterium]